MKLSVAIFPCGKKTKGAAFALALGALALLPAPSHARRQEGQSAQPPAAARQHPRRGNHNNLLRRLNLTPEQLAQLGEIRRQSEGEARELTRRLRLARRALDEAIYSDALSESLVEQRAAEVVAAQSALVRLRSQTELKVRRVLTPEQLQSFRELRRRAQRRQMLQRRGRRGNPEADPRPSQDAQPGDESPAGRMRGRRRRP